MVVLPVALVRETKRQPPLVLPVNYGLAGDRVVLLRDGRVVGERVLAAATDRSEAVRDLLLAEE